MSNQELLDQLEYSMWHIASFGLRRDPEVDLWSADAVRLLDEIRSRML